MSDLQAPAHGHQPDPAHDHTATRGYEKDKARYLARVRRIQGQLRGIERMIEEDKYCIDVLTQISAANSALKSLGLSMLDAHLHHCVVAAADGGNLDEKLTEASQAIGRFVR